MQPDQIAALLAPFEISLTDKQISQLAAYLEILLRWNSRMNLTAVRQPESIVTRHFGESLWAAAHLLAPEGISTGLVNGVDREAQQPSVIDVGSGAGFPGLALKIFSPAIRLTLIEAQNKKATFLKEAIRTLGFSAVEVYCGRAEHYVGRAELVTLRAVEKFDIVLPTAARLLNGPGSQLALLIGRPQCDHAKELVPDLHWQQTQPVPLSTDRILLIGTSPGEDSAA
jgi:16S rRNA (guanine527-N7)-methyltransferase